MGGEENYFVLEKIQTNLVTTFARRMPVFDWLPHRWSSRWGMGRRGSVTGSGLNTETWLSKAKKRARLCISFSSPLTPVSRICTCRLCVCICFYSRGTDSLHLWLTMVDFCCWWESEDNHSMCEVKEIESGGLNVGQGEWRWCACIEHHWLHMSVTVIVVAVWTQLFMYGTLTVAFDAQMHCCNLLFMHFNSCSLILILLSFVPFLILSLIWATRWAHYLDLLQILDEVRREVWCLSWLANVFMGSVMCRLEPQAFRLAWLSSESCEICASEFPRGRTFISGYVQTVLCVFLFSFLFFLPKGGWGISDVFPPVLES